MRLHIIRHAETEYNKLGVIQGSEVDSELNKIGLRQSELFYEYYKNHNFKKIYVSGLMRTFQTVKKFTDNGFPYEKISDFNEISWGVNQGKNDDLAEYKMLTDSWKAGNLDNKFENGESPNEMVVRLMIGLEKILNDNLDSVLLCIHGRALRVLLSKIIDNDLTMMDKYVHSNTGMYIIEYNEGKYSIIKSNLREHLER
ncbi:MAG: histidine phosphatase family protein [Flammeovirgaceae bacterium]|nr:histidine phosphatase family protein [Flammeovirgaceae bacterium]|tara:strand:+ start:6633 stop:7229 length:597 start_codon:yes stop_codon:yes gene_type:complete